MSTEQFLSRNAFDDIIASLEALRTEMQNLVASVDDLNDPGVIADIQALAGQIDALTDVANNLPVVVSVNDALPAITAVNDALAAVNTVSGAIAEIGTVAGISGEVTAVAGISGDVTSVAGISAQVQEVADNMQAVVDALQHAQDALQYAEEAQTWAEGTDSEVSELGGEKSSKGWASRAQQSEQAAASYANFAGFWEDQTGQHEPPLAVLHNGLLWGLAVEVADITLSEPSTGNEDWILLSARELLGLGISQKLDPMDFDIGGGESVLDTGFSGEIVLFINGAQQDADNFSKIGTILTIFTEINTNDQLTVIRFSELGNVAPLVDMAELDRKQPEAGDLLLLEDSEGEKFASEFAEVIFQRQKLVYTKDFMPFNMRSVVEGSGVFSNENSNFDYYKTFQTGDTPTSRVMAQNPLRHGIFKLNTANGRQQINFGRRIQFIQHIGITEWTQNGEIECSFGRRFNVDSDVGERMFGFIIRSNDDDEPVLWLRVNNGTPTPTELNTGEIINVDTLPVGSIEMDFYPGEAFVLTVNGNDYELTSNLPTGVRVNTIPGCWDVRNGADSAEVRMDIYRNEVTVMP